MNLGAHLSFITLAVISFAAALYPDQYGIQNAAYNLQERNYYTHPFSYMTPPHSFEDVPSDVHYEKNFPYYKQHEYLPGDHLTQPSHADFIYSSRDAGIPSDKNGLYYDEDFLKNVQNVAADSIQSGNRDNLGLDAQETTFDETITGEIGNIDELPIFPFDNVIPGVTIIMHGKNKKQVNRLQSKIPPVASGTGSSLFDRGIGKLSNVILSQAAGFDANKKNENKPSKFQVRNQTDVTVQNVFKIAKPPKTISTRQNQVRIVNAQEKSTTRRSPVRVADPRKKSITSQNLIGNEESLGNSKAENTKSEEFRSLLLNSRPEIESKSRKDRQFSFPTGSSDLHKHIFVYAAPDEKIPEIVKVTDISRPNEVHYKILFIKAPGHAQPKISLPEIKTPEVKTLVYVLQPKQKPIDVPKFLASTTPKPEPPKVFFVKYGPK